VPPDAEIERMLTAGLGSIRCPASRRASRDARGRRVREAEGLATKAQKLIIAEAEANFEQREIQTGVARYKAAIALHEEAKGRDALAAALRARAMNALTEGKDASLAVPGRAKAWR
jgi:hypothetical protein